MSNGTRTAIQFWEGIFLSGSWWPLSQNAWAKMATVRKQVRKKSATGWKRSEQDPERTYVNLVQISDYCAVKKVFCENYVRKCWKRFKNPKNLKNFRKRPNASNCFRMHPNASQWVRMDPKASKSSRKPQKTCENFEKLRKNFEKLREKFYKNFFHGVVCGVQ